MHTRRCLVVERRAHRCWVVCLRALTFARGCTLRSLLALPTVVGLQVVFPARTRDPSQLRSQGGQPPRRLGGERASSNAVSRADETQEPTFIALNLPKAAAGGRRSRPLPPMLIPRLWPRRAIEYDRSAARCQVGCVLLSLSGCRVGLFVLFALSIADLNYPPSLAEWIKCWRS